MISCPLEEEEGGISPYSSSVWALWQIEPMKRDAVKESLVLYEVGGWKFSVACTVKSSPLNLSFHEVYSTLQLFCAVHITEYALH